MEPLPNMGLQPTSAVGRRKRLPLALAAESRYVGQTSQLEADPPELAAICDGLRRAYPAGLLRTDPEYPAVVALLAAICCSGQAAVVLERALLVHWGIAHNDVLGAGIQGSAGPAWDAMVARLEPLGLRSWLDEEDFPVVFPREPW